MRRRRSLGFAVAAAVLLMSCSGAPAGGDDTVQDADEFDPMLPATTSLVTTLPDSTAARCDRIGSRVIKEFVATFNDGVTDLDPYFASGEEYQWFSDDQRVGNGPSSSQYDPYNRSTLIDYLNEARRTRGPMTIRSLKFASFRHFDQATGYAMEFEWDGHRHLGKSSVHCGLEQINVWSLGPANP